jgi:two-component system, cell cycle response regulator
VRAGGVTATSGGVAKRQLIVLFRSLSALMRATMSATPSGGDGVRVREVEGPVSLRARLAVVLACVMVAPLIAAWVAVGVLVPQTSSRAAQAAADRTAGSASVALADSCAGIGDAARALAFDVRSRLAATGSGSPGAVGSGSPGATGLSASAAGQAVAAEADHRPGTTLALLSDARLLAAAGPLAEGLDASAATTAAASSCTLRQAVTGGPAVLAESVAIADGDTVVVRAVALEPLDGAALADLTGRLGVDGAVALVRTSATGARPSVVAASARLPELAAVLDELATGATSGQVGDLRYHLEDSPSGVPYALLAVEPVQGGGLQLTLLVVLLAAVLLSMLLIRMLADRLTQPLARLTRTAERLGAGDLAARVGAVGGGEVGAMATAFDTMAGQLQTKIDELEISRDALRDTFDRFGEALGRTHDIDGLLYTVVEAAMRGADGIVGTALLGDARSLEERVSAVRDGGPTAVIGALDDLARLAADAVRRGEPAIVADLPSAGPAIAVPMEKDGRTIGALAVARADGGEPLDAVAAHAVEALAAHTGAAVANVRAHEETRRQSVTDPLTGTGNFRQLTTTLNREVERATRFTRPLSVLMLDLDHFKLVNDTQGHAFGDAVLREFAHRLTDCLREVDVVARYGGEEFAIVLPETDSAGASAVATRILAAIRSQPFDCLGHVRAVTVSVGVASFPDHGRTAADVMRAADGALYAAKRGGRDRWCLAGGAGEGKPLSMAR